MFRQVETKATMDNGRTIIQVVSDPKGISHEEYTRIDLGMVAAFPGASVMTEGWFLNQKE